MASGFGVLTFGFLRGNLSIALYLEDYVQVLLSMLP